MEEKEEMDGYGVELESEESSQASAPVSPEPEPSTSADAGEREAECLENYLTEGGPSLLFPSNTLMELCTCSWSKVDNCKKDIQPFVRGCKWSPDGTCCLTAVNKDGMHVSELPRDLYEGNVKTDRPLDILESVIHIKEAGLVYDFCWYPRMNSYQPETCFWLSTLQNSPIQMWDAFDGSLKSSYRGYNAVDEMEPALSVTFSPDCTKIVGGYRSSFRTFDVERPGRDYTEHTVRSPVSCMTTDNNLLAAGSWNASISLYSIRECGTYRSIGKLYGHSGGVTHMKFTPDGNRLVTGSRCDYRILVWDIRCMERPLNILTRTVQTNQRIYFDISPCGKYLVSGATNGVMRVWDATETNWSNGTGTMDEPTYKFWLYDDCCNSVAINPLRPILATGSGQIHVPEPFKNEPCDEGCQCETPVEANKHIEKSENKLSFWWIGGLPHRSTA